MNIPDPVNGLINGDNKPNAIYIWNGLTLFDNADSSGTTDPKAAGYSAPLPGVDALGGKLDPRLALSWQTPTEADPKTWSFKLRQGVKFHDGTPFNAQAVDFTWKRLLNPDKNDNSGVEAASRLAKGFESLEIVDD